MGLFSVIAAAELKYQVHLAMNKLQMETLHIQSRWNLFAFVSSGIVCILPIRLFFVEMLKSLMLHHEFTSTQTLFVPFGNLRSEQAQQHTRKYVRDRAVALWILQHV